MIQKPSVTSGTLLKTQLLFPVMIVPFLYCRIAVLPTTADRRLRCGAGARRWPSNLETSCRAPRHLVAAEPLRIAYSDNSARRRPARQIATISHSLMEHREIFAGTPASRPTAATDGLLFVAC